MSSLLWVAVTALGSSAFGLNCPVLRVDVCALLPSLPLFLLASPTPRQGGACLWCFAARRLVALLPALVGPRLCGVAHAAPRHPPCGICLSKGRSALSQPGFRSRSDAAEPEITHIPVPFSWRVYLGRRVTDSVPVSWESFARATTCGPQSVSTLCDVLPVCPRFSTPFFAILLSDWFVFSLASFFLCALSQAAGEHLQH